MIAQINGKKLHYELSGNGVPILLVHGWGGSFKSLFRLHQLLSGKYKSILIDLPGFGESDNPDPEWGVGKYASHITTFIEYLGLGPVFYFGHSFGGAIGIYIASHNDKFIQKLILCNSAFKRKPRRANRGGESNKIFKNSLIYPLLKKIYYRVFYPDSDILVAPHLESNFRKIVKEDLTPDITNIRKSTLVLWGEQDKTTPVEWGRELHEKIKNSTLKIFPEARHGLPLKYPEKIFPIISEFINT